MIIANPIYDVVFKHLMGDPEIAQGILERILDTRIDGLTFGATEHTTESRDGRLTFFRLDFKARILEPDGTWKSVLIELQKARLESDLERFRRYLAEEYRRLEDVQAEDGTIQKEQSLPIITVYFFGYEIDAKLPAAVKIDRQYVDLITGERLSVRSDVLERLTHDCYAVQIPKLQKQRRNEIEDLLSVFRQDEFADDSGHSLVIREDDEHSEFVKKMIRRLMGVAEQEEVRKQMDEEDFIVRTLKLEIDAKTRSLTEELRVTAEELAERQRLHQEAESRREEEQRRREEADRQRDDLAEKAIQTLVDQGMTEEQARKALGLD